MVGEGSSRVTCTVRYPLFSQFHCARHHSTRHSTLRPTSCHSARRHRLITPAMPGSSSAVTVSSPRFDRPPPPIVLAAGVLSAHRRCPHHPHRHRGRRGGIRCGVCRPGRVEAASTRQGPRSSRTPRPPSGMVSEESGPARCTRSRQGGTSRCYGGPDRTSPSKSYWGGASADSEDGEGRAAAGRSGVTRQ